MRWFEWSSIRRYVQRCQVPEKVPYPEVLGTIHVHHDSEEAAHAVIKAIVDRKVRNRAALICDSN